MEADFWLQRWHENKIGFHLDEVNPLLVRHFQSLGVTPPARVFVPLCGKSVDIIWLRAQGYDVVAVEISPLAVRDFFREQQLSPVQKIVDGLTLWQADGLQIWCADFFALQARHLGDVAATYDRAALIAMPAEMRLKYTQHLLDITRAAPQMLITLDYPQAQMGGPPFAVDRAEVTRRYSEFYTGAGKPHVSVDVLPSHARFAERGLTSLYENVYLLQVLKK